MTSDEWDLALGLVWQWAPPHPGATSAQQGKAMGIRANACSLPFVVAETPPSSKNPRGTIHSALSRPRSSRHDHPSCNTVQGSPQAAQPSRPSCGRVLIGIAGTKSNSLHLFIHCVSVLQSCRAPCLRRLLKRVVQASARLG